MSSLIKKKEKNKTNDNKRSYKYNNLFVMKKYCKFLKGLPAVASERNDGGAKLVSSLINPEYLFMCTNT